MPETKPAPMAYPLSLMDDPAALVALVHEIGADEFNRRMQDAARDHMRLNGTRSILDVGEAMDRCTAILEEFVTETE